MLLLVRALYAVIHSLRIQSSIVIDYYKISYARYMTIISLTIVIFVKSLLCDFVCLSVYVFISVHSVYYA